MPQPADPTPLAATFGDASLDAELPLIIAEQRLGIAGAVGARYEIREMIGAGSSGRVWLVYDRELGREIAVKSLAPGIPPERAEAFLREARIAAAIEHPNVVPVYNVSVTELGQVWIAMKRVEGQSLDLAIAAAIEGKPPAAIASFNQRVNVVVHVCNAMRAAHAAGFLHRDIKPANIMLGIFGEVLVVDWGTASVGATPGRGTIVGTPLYMSPEQARGEEGGRSTDIYGIGSTLFELLVLRPPLQAASVEEFWRRKKLGDIDAPTAAERSRVPRHLLAIALKALAAHAQDRYHSVEALVDDLSRYQAGQAISACRDTAGEWLARSHRRHGLRLWLGAAMIAMVVLVGSIMYAQHRAQMATWGQAVFTEHFADDTWQKKWNVLDGSWETKDQWLVSTGKNGSLLWLPQRFSGPTAIEYEAMIRPDSPPCDISLVWSRQPQFEEKGWPRLGAQHFKCQVGAYDGNFTTIMNEKEQFLAFSEVKPIPGQVHRVRIEIVDDSIVIMLDGVELCRWRDNFPLVGGYFGFYAFYPGKSFRNLSVYSLGVPARPLATAVGDAFAQRGDFLTAAEEYSRVVVSQPPHSELWTEAAYLQGLCLERSEKHEAADAAWALLAGSARADHVLLHHLARDFARGARQSVIDGLVALAKRPHNADFHGHLVNQWSQCVRELSGVVRHTFNPAAERDLDAFIAIREPWFTQDHGADRNFGEALIIRKRYTEVLEQLPRQHWLCARSLIALGRADEVEKAYPEQRLQITQALIAMGEFARIERDFPEIRQPVEPFSRGLLSAVHPMTGNAAYPTGGLAMIFLGEFDQALATWPDNPIIRVRCQLHQGNRAAFIAAEPLHSVSRLLTGKAAEWLADETLPDRDIAAIWLAIDALARGDRSVVLPLVERAVTLRPAGIPVWNLNRDLLLPLVADTVDGGHRVDLAIADWSQRGWRDRRSYETRGKYHTGHLDDAAFLAQPIRLLVEAELVFHRAVRADRAGQREQALADYRLWMAMPSWKKSWDVDVPSERWAEWRILALQERQ